MSDVKSFLQMLEEGELLIEGKVFSKEQLDPVIIQKPPKGGQGRPSPPPKGGGQINVEIHNVEPPEGAGAPGEDEDDDKTTTKGEKPKDGKGKGKKGKEKDGDEEKDADGEGTGDKEDKGERKATDDGVEIEKKKVGSGEPEGKQTKSSGPNKRRTSLDSHDIINKSNANGARELAERIFKEAAEKRAKKGQSGRGTNEGGFIEKLAGAYESRLDWKEELKDKINIFQSDTARAMDKWLKVGGRKYKEGVGKLKSKSYNQWLRNPRSHATMGKKDQMIFKGPYVKSPVSEVVLIVALDTSGSVGGETFEKVFGEMDDLAAKFQRGMTTGGQKLEGKVYFMTWDTQVNQVDHYKAGDWKKYVTGERGIKGRGGTDLSNVYEYLNDHVRYDAEEDPSMGVFNIMKKPTETAMDDDDVVLPFDIDDEVPKIAPFLLIATDGYFGNITDSILGDLYKDNKDSIVYLIIDGTDEYCYPKNIIKYDEIRI